MPFIKKIDDFGSPVELAEEKRGGEVEMTNTANSLRIFAVNEATEGFIFSKSELLRHMCNLMLADIDDTREMECDSESEVLEKWVRTGGIQGTRDGFGC